MFAQQNAIAQKVTVDFRTQEYHDIAAYKEHFDFIFDWRFLHEITDENQRDMYIKIIDTLLTPNGKYLSVAFSGDTDFMGT
jgi:2-polyprenyl-3-methyl-5-hydroxy-6-metoxy-1,4-benzoquinol methylase